MPRKQPKALLLTLSLEVLSIVFGVLLALGANAWYQHVKEQQLVRSVLADIAVEVDYNAVELERVLSYHRMLADTLSRVLSVGQVSSFDLRGIWRGAQVPSFQSAAYETAVVTEALSLMEFAVSSHLASLYKQQQSLERLFSRYLEAVLIDPLATDRMTHIVWMMSGDVVLGESALLERYHSTRTYLVEQAQR